MSDVQRFTWNREDEVVDPSDDGEYVKYEDYLELKKEVEMLDSMIYDIQMSQE